ncbi:hypothetical protein BDN67DRAFT_481184 [Paxillus ammoniavirescens]|nr:hypothetical protein BDN67DRAFT_481184 [Paxillus ammoniavirescens]
MPPVGTPGIPREGNKPEPAGNIALVVLSTTCTLCLLYILWRRASRIRAVVSHQLKTWTTQEGQIRLSEDDGPPATEFLADDDVPPGISQDNPSIQAKGTRGTGDDQANAVN